MIEAGKFLQERYRVDRQIGQGGMGAVYIATDERFGSVVAIKQTLCMDDNYRRAIEREAKLLNSLKHNALPRVTDHFVDTDGQFLVMEYIPGEDLSVTLDERQDPYPVGEVLDWADQLLDALNFLHNQENPVIHRDIKPQNLKLTLKGQIILLDFGLAKGNVTGAGNLSNAKSIFGFSRNYASLEQIQGTGTDPRSDLYSLAATLYHLLTKVPPEDALTRAMAVLTQKPDPLVPANQIRPEIPAGVAAILHKALDLDASERPSSAEAMREMLVNHAKFSDLTFSTVSVARGVSPDIHAAPTQLMPGTTLNEFDKATHFGESVVSGGVSQVTAVRPLADRAVVHIDRSTGSNSFAGRPHKRRYALWAGAGLLLIAAAGAVGVLTLAPGLFTSSEEVPQTVEDTAVPQVVDQEQKPAEAPVAETAGSGSNEPTADVSAADGPVKKPETAKVTSKQTSKTVSSTAANDGNDEKIVVKGDNIDIGEIKVRNGKVFMPDGTIYDENGVPVRIPKNGQPGRFPNIDMRRLTPDQRRKLRIIQQRYPDPPPIPSPKPQ